MTKHFLGQKERINISSLFMISTLSQSSKIYIKALKERKKKAITINCGELRTKR